jgi:hypothetical protein
LKFDALKCRFLHSEHYICSLNLSSHYLYFRQKLRKVLIVIWWHAILVLEYSCTFENQSFQY